MQLQVLSSHKLERKMHFELLYLPIRSDQFPLKKEHDEV